MNHKESHISYKAGCRRITVPGFHPALSCLIAAGLSLCTAGCEDDEAVTGLTVIETELNFDAPASKGFAIVSDADCTAKLSEAWCRAEQKGDSILVYVDNNQAMEGRTAMLTVTGNHGNGIQNIPITQKGGYFRTDGETELYADDNAQTIFVPVTATYDYQILLPERAWITYDKTPEGIHLHLAENTGGLPRRIMARIVCPVMNMEKSIFVAQYDLNDLMGQWNAAYAYKQGNEFIETTETVTLALTGENEVEMTGLKATNGNGLTLKGEADGHTFFFRTGKDLGPFLNFRIFQYGVNEAGIVYTKEKEEAERKFSAQLHFTGQNGLECVFTPDSAFSDGTYMTGLAVSAYQEDVNRGIAGTFINLKLTRE